MTELQPVTIDVTADDIRAGQPGNDCACPIGLALDRVLRPGVLFSVRRGGLILKNGDVFITLPTVALRFIRLFDWGLPVQPFSFELPLPVDLLRETIQTKGQRP